MAVVAPPPLRPQDELEALIEEARRRRARRRRRNTGALITVAIAVAAGFKLADGGQANGTQGQPRPLAHHPGSDPALAATLPGARTNLWLWPAGKPRFGDLPGGGPGTTVRVSDLATGAWKVDRIPQIAGGDFPYTLLSVGRWVVYNSDSGVATIRADLTGPMRVLGRAYWFVPGTDGGVWLVTRLRQTSWPASVRRVNVRTGAGSPAITLPPHTVIVQGTRHGLLLITGGPEHWRLALWNPDAPHPETIAPLSFSASLFASDTTTAAYGSSCRYHRHQSGSIFLCQRLTITDLTSGKHRSITAPAGTVGWAAPLGVMRGANTISPDHRYLAIQAAVPSNHGETLRVYRVALGGNHPPTPTPNSASPPGTLLAWTNSGDWLVYETAKQHLNAWRPGAQPRTLAVPCCGATILTTH